MKVIYKSGNFSTDTIVQLTIQKKYLTHNKIYDTLNPHILFHTFFVTQKNRISKKEYEKEYEDFLLINCDDNNHRWIPKEHFITLDEHRDKLIEDITNESNL